MTNCDLVIISELAEELAIICNSVVDLSRHLDSLACLVLDEIKNVSLGLFDIGRLTGDLHTCLATTLTWDINGNLELRLQILLGLSTSSDQRAMFVSWDFDRLDCLAVSFRNDFLHSCNDLLYNVLIAFDLDRVSLRTSLRELDSSGKFSAVIRSSSFNNNISKSRTYVKLALVNRV